MTARERRYARRGVPAWCALVSLSVGCAANAYGQSDTDALAAVRACSALENDAERLACLDAALGTNAAADAPTAGPVVAPVAAPVAAPAAEERATVEQPPAGDRRSSDEERSIRIVEIRRTGLGVTTFTAEDGTVWENRGGTEGRFPPVPFDAVLRPALGDSYFLISPLGGRRTRVQQR